MTDANRCPRLLLVLVLLWLGVALPTTAQSLPFTPTPTATDTATPTATAPPTATPTTPPLVIIATPTALPPTLTPTPTPLPPGYGRDSCDPNHTLEQPCAVPTETDLPNLNFTDDPVDVFSVLLKGGRQYRIRITVGAAGGLDPALALFRAGAVEQPIATNDDVQIGDPTAAVTLTVALDGWYLARVTNQAPGDPLGKSYTFSARSVGPTSSSAPGAPDDLLGNAYDVAHAARIAWNVPYDLSLICPDARPGACYAGRHSFLLVPIKRGIPLVSVTYDLGAGVDTVLTLYAPDPTQTQAGPGVLPGWRAVVTSDDIAPGWTLRSQLTLTPAWSGVGLLVIAPSERQDVPALPTDGRPGRYRLIVGSPALRAVHAVLAAQDDLPPTPTARPTGQAAPAAVGTAQDAREVIKEACPTGQAVVGAQATGLYAAAPPGDDDRIARYPISAAVELLGQCYRGWVKVQPSDSVTPGWMWAPDLRPDALTARTPTPPPHSPPIDGSPLATSDLPPPALPVTTVALEPLDPLPLPTAALPQPVARAVTVTVCRVPRTGAACATPLVGLHLALLLAATRQVLTNGSTDRAGMVTLSVSVPSGSLVLLTIPALGLETPLGERVTDVPVRVPQGAP